MSKVKEGKIYFSLYYQMLNQKYEASVEMSGCVHKKWCEWVWKRKWDCE